MFNDSCARVNWLMETIKEQQEHFVSEMREFGLFNETNPSLPIPRLESSLYDNYGSSIPLESNVVDDAPLLSLRVTISDPGRCYITQVRDVTLSLSHESLNVS